MRRPVLLAVAALALLALPAGLVAADEGWVVDRFVADITIHPDASLHIVETIDVDFGSSQRHGIFRDVPVRYRYDDTHVRVYRLTVGSVTDASDRAIPYQVTDQGGYREIKVGDANVLVSGRRSYRISYDVVGAMNAFADRDELFWNVNGGSWPVATTLAMATVHAPVGIDRLACYQGLAGATNACPTALSASKDSATFGPSHRLASGEQLTLVAALAKGAIAEPMPILARDTDNALTSIEPQPAYLALAVALLVGALALLFWRWYTAGRDLRERETIVPEYEPPDGVRPAQAGLIIDESADTKDVTATIVDLAVRGYATITEVPSEGLFGKTDWNIAATSKSGQDLVGYERIIYDGLFDGRAAVKLTELRRTFAETLHSAEGSLYDDSVARGWFARRPDRTRLGYIGLGVLGIVAGVALAFVLGRAIGAGLIGLAVVLVGIVVLATAGIMPAKTAAGAELLRRTLGFRRYMEVAEKDRARFAERENIFSEYLPFAIVFGCVDRWARAFAGIDTARQTGAWYVGTSPFSTMQLSSSLQGFSTNLGSAIAATAGSSGGSGFSGGAGGGGGGGGGGSW